jgi:hypothetical protein
MTETHPLRHDWTLCFLDCVHVLCCLHVFNIGQMQLQHEDGDDRLY